MPTKPRIPVLPPAANIRTTGQARTLPPAFVLQPKIAPRPPSLVIQRSALPTVVREVSSSSSSSSSGTDHDRDERKTPAIAPVGSSVSASSAHHDLNLIKSKAASAAAKLYGFSFVNKATERADVDMINEYIKGKRVKGSDGQVITHGPATHAGAKLGMIQYLINGRIYSTHADTTQLFPVSGTGIVNGNGIADMLKELKKLGKLDLKTFYAVSTAGGVATPWAQLGTRQKKEYEEAFTAYMR